MEVSCVVSFNGSVAVDEATYKLPPIKIPQDRASCVTHDLGNGIKIEIVISPKD